MGTSHSSAGPNPDSAIDTTTEVNSAGLNFSSPPLDSRTALGRRTSSPFTITRLRGKHAHLCEKTDSDSSTPSPSRSRMAKRPSPPVDRTSVAEKPAAHKDRLQNGLSSASQYRVRLSLISLKAPASVPTSSLPLQKQAQRNHFRKTKRDLSPPSSALQMQEICWENHSPPRALTTSINNRVVSRTLTNVYRDTSTISHPQHTSRSFLHDPKPFPLPLFLSSPSLLASFLQYLSYRDAYCLFHLSKSVKAMLTRNELLREEVLERFLGSVGYVRWDSGPGWGGPEPIVISISDLHGYMRGVSIPVFEYARVADLVLQISDNSILRTTRNPDRVAIVEKAMLMVNATRAYNRVLLRLRAQAEKDSMTPSRDHSVDVNLSHASNRPPPSGVACTHSLPLSEKCCCNEGVTLPLSDQGGVLGFRSSIFSLNRAPLLRVFVPSPAGEWLSNTSILECEAELKLADVLGQMRLGDVVWDLAVGDHGNAGKLIWDGSYLIDLDYTYSPIGDIPKYIPGFAFPPSYFHRIIRSSTLTPSQSDDPIIRLDLTPWGAEIISNVKLVEDRVRVKSAQGVYQEIVHWVHRSSFHLHALAIDKCNFTSSAAQDYYLNSDVSASITATTPLASRIPIPDTTLFVDPDWYGRIVIETEGTNEALADLQERCGMAEFPTAQGRRGWNKKREQEWEGRMVYRILPERSRPGERWIRAVSPKQKFLT